jgi:hypothetical protein
MTDDARNPGRIDLRAIDEPVLPAQADRVIANAMSRARGRAGQREDVAASLLAYARPVLAAAAVLLILAAGAMRLAPARSATTSSSSILATWAEAGHVPTNGELLAAFQGYER